MPTQYTNKASDPIVSLTVKKASTAPEKTANQADKAGYYAPNEHRPGHKFTPYYSHEKTALLLEQAEQERDSARAAIGALLDRLGEVQSTTDTLDAIDDSLPALRAAIAAAEKGGQP